MRHLYLLGLLPMTLVACGGTTADGDGDNNSPSTAAGSGGDGGTGGDGGSTTSSTGGLPAKGGAPGTAGGSGAGGYAAGGSGAGGYAAGGVYQGGRPGWGGDGGSTAAAGSTAWGGEGGQVACCLAMAVCNEGDTEIPGPDACSPGGDCYSSSICCSTVWCERSSAAVDGGSAPCNPEAEPDRQYVGDSPNECMLIDFACPANTEYFGNACGCGCEQNAECPEWVDCMPGPDPNPGCSDEALALCPYTQIAY